MTAVEFADLVESRRPRLLSIAASRLRRGGHTDGAEDIVQMTILRMLPKCDTISASEFGAYSETILRNLVREHGRRDVAHVRPNAADAARALADSGMAEAHARERLQLDVALALEALPDTRTQRAAMMVYGEGWSCDEAGRAIGLSGRRVRELLAAALPLLREALKGYAKRPASHVSHPPIEEGGGVGRDAGTELAA